MFCPRDGERLDTVKSESLVGQVIDARYRLERIIGTGSFGHVYEAKHVHLSRRFAVKILRDQLARDPKQRRRLLREAETACRVSHPNLVSAIDVGEPDDGPAYLVMDLAPGESLAAILGSAAPLPRERIIGLVRQIAEGLGHAHAHGMVHRDLKPSNMIVEALEGGGEHLRIIDFGLAIPEPYTPGERLTSVGLVLGTPAYLAPEQATCSAIDHRADFYSLGVVLYEMLSGLLPFEGSVVEIVSKHIHNTPPRIVPRPDPLLEALAFWLMEKRPDARPQHADHVLELLDMIEQDPSSAQIRLANWAAFDAEPTLRLSPEPA